MDLLSNLNPQQREAVCQTDGPLLILAGAGSGKTRVITHRIAHLIAEKGVASHRILAVTFTNKAAGEMKDRVEVLLGERAKGLWVSTFHSTCARLLRRHAGRIGLSRDFALYDAADQMSLVKECFSEMNLNEELYPPRTILARIGRLKHRLIEPEEFGRSASPFGLDEKVYRVYLRYQEKLARAGGLDFDDLIGGAIRLFETAPDLLAGYQEQFCYIMVDEYQDTNHAQYRLVNLLARRHGNLCVVGDDDQSIYAFRGADVTNILSFERDYPRAHVITLGQNYRSTQSILDAASTVIAKNLRRKEKRLFTEKGAGDRPTWCRVADEMEEARYLCRTIRRLKREDGLDYANFCVLYRTNAQSRVIEEAFRSEEIPYLIVGGLKFYERKEVKDLIAYLRVIVNPSDNVGLRRIINVPARGIGGVNLDRLSDLAEERGVPLYEALAEAIGSEEFSAPARRGMSAFHQLIERFRPEAAVLPPGTILKEIVKEIRYEEALRKEHGPEAEARIENVWELLAAAEEMEGPEGLRLFLDQVALVSASDGNQDDLEKSGGSVTLMTLHSAKGLEFPVVFMAGMEEGLFPHAGAQTDPAELEEERRLCYVGITRAKERLYFTSALQRRLYGSSRWGSTSRFVEELLPTRQIEVEEYSSDGFGLDAGRLEDDSRAYRPRVRRSGSTGRRSDEAPYSFSSPRNGGSEESRGPASPFPEGSYVRHPVFGVGRVERSEGRGESQYLTVSFSGAGTKKLSLKYAKLEKL